MFLVTGDIHGLRSVEDIQRLSTAHQELFDMMTKEDYLIIAGDFGLVWDSSVEEIQLQQWLEDRPFTTLFVDGNHENFDLLDLLYPVRTLVRRKNRRSFSQCDSAVRGSGLSD